jgi:hypothetical protein
MVIHRQQPHSPQPMRFGLAPPLLCSLNHLGGFGEPFEPFIRLPRHSINLPQRRQVERQHRDATYCVGVGQSFKEQRDALRRMPCRAQTPAADHLSERGPQREAVLARYSQYLIG